MIGELKVLALIPARGGSKGLPRKNIKPLLGKPLIAWTIEAARNSRYVDSVVVSTDDPEIADCASAWGGEVPFIRPAELAHDTSPTMDTISHAIDALSVAGRDFDVLVLLEPTSPLRESSDIDEALDTMLKTPGAESVVGVGCAETTHPSFLVKMEKSAFIHPYEREEFGVRRRQDLKPVYFLEGSVYISYVQSLRIRRTFYHDATIGYLVPRYKTFEIDNLCDFVVVEALIKARREGVILQ